MAQIKYNYRSQIKERKPKACAGWTFSPLLLHLMQKRSHDRKALDKPADHLSARVRRVGSASKRLAAGDVATVSNFFSFWDRQNLPKFGAPFFDAGDVAAISVFFSA